MIKYLDYNCYFCCSCNIGDEPWPAGCQLRYCSGENLSNTDRAVLGILNPKETADVSVQMHSPSAAGVYQSQWRMCTSTGMYFGGNY